MTDQPLTPTATKVIVLTPSVVAADDRAAQFNLSINNSIFLVVMTENEARAVDAPEGTPWVTMPNFSMRAAFVLYERFGLSITWSSALKMINNEYAIRPEVLRGGGPSWKR